jgi:TrmH family RNA methyltransferase
MITSSANDRLKRVRRLRKRRARDDEGVFLVEGYRQVRRAVDAGVEITELFAAPDLYQGAGEAELAAALDAAEVAAEPFASITTRDRPDGLLAVARQFDTSLARQRPIAEDALLLVTEGVERPGNLGTMIRAACAAGVTGVIAADPQTDLFAPEVVRASVGTLFLQPVSVAAAEETAAWLKANHVQIVTASPDARLTYWDADLTMRTAVVVGSEQHGVTPLWFDAADAAVRIPMQGPVDSLNVAAAASILLFDAVRQRQSTRP